MPARERAGGANEGVNGPPLESNPFSRAILL